MVHQKLRGGEEHVFTKRTLKIEYIENKLSQSDPE